LRRHLNSWLAFTSSSSRRATIETDAPGSNVSATDPALQHLGPLPALTCAAAALSVH
jgi:hypothetical protein